MVPLTRLTRWPNDTSSPGAMPTMLAGTRRASRVPRLRSYPQGVHVRIHDLPFVRARSVGRKLKESSTVTPKLGRERVDIVNADPDPGPGVSLCPLTEHDGVTAVRYRGHLGADLSPPIHTKPQNVPVVPK